LLFESAINQERTVICVSSPFRKLKNVTTTLRLGESSTHQVLILTFEEVQCRQMDIDASMESRHHTIEHSLLKTHF